MIKVRLFKTKTDTVYGFTVKNHSSGIVCAAVSILVQNTINCIEHFTNDKFECDYIETGGFLDFCHPLLKKGGVSKDASLLINAMVFGLYGIKKEYENEIDITWEVKND